MIATVMLSVNSLNLFSILGDNFLIMLMSMPMNGGTIPRSLKDHQEIKQV